MSDAISFLVDEPEGEPLGGLTVVLAHGAGAPMDSPFMDQFAAGLAARGLRAARFEFPYMVERRASGKRRPPNPMRILEATWLQAIDQLGGGERLVIGGKSMGGRVASRVADRAKVAGLVCLGYPFHPPGRPEKTRTEHLAELATPTLVVQGTRDPFGTPDDVAGYTLADSIGFHWLEDGDHSFKPRKKSGHTLDEHMEAALDAATRFVATRSS